MVIQAFGKRIKMNDTTRIKAECLANAIESLLDFLHNHNSPQWQDAFDRPLKELREWGNLNSAIKLLKEIPLGGMGGILDRDFGKDQKKIDGLCDLYHNSLQALEQSMEQ